MKITTVDFSPNSGTFELFSYTIYYHPCSFMLNYLREASKAEKSKQINFHTMDMSLTISLVH